MNDRAFSPEELTRYSRHLLLSEIGMEGQLKIKQARVLLIGAGGLGSPAALYLAAAGIGTIGIFDFDTVDRTNLQRQVLYSTPEIGRRKCDVAQEKILAINPNVAVQVHAIKLVQNNAREIVQQYDIVLDGSDNFETRYLVNDVAIALGKPIVFGSIYRFEGQVSVFGLGDGPCYRCLFPEGPLDATSCADVGVLGVLPGLIGILQATEALKIITGIGDTLKGRLLLYDALRMKFDEIRIEKNEHCPTCGTTEKVAAYPSFSKSNSFTKSNPSTESTLIPETLPENSCLIDVRTPQDFAAENIGGISIPLEELAGRIEEIPRDKTIYLVCNIGTRSEIAKDMLEEHGFEAVSLAGGLQRLRRENVMKY